MIKETPVTVFHPISITLNDEKGFYLILKEDGGIRTCNMGLDSEETAHLILGLLKNRPMPWPTPYDISLSILDKLDISIKKVVVNRVIPGEIPRYESLIHLQMKDGGTEEIAARPPFAIILALIKKCPIFVADKLLLVDEWINKGIAEAVTRDALERSGTMSDEDARRFLEGFDDKGKTKN